MMFVEYLAGVFEQILAGGENSANGIAEIVGGNFEQLNGVKGSVLPAIRVKIR